MMRYEVGEHISVPLFATICVSIFLILYLVLHDISLEYAAPPCTFQVDHPAAKNKSRRISFKRRAVRAFVVLMVVAALVILPLVVKVGATDLEHSGFGFVSIIFAFRTLQWTYLDRESWTHQYLQHLEPQTSKGADKKKGVAGPWGPEPLRFSSFLLMLYRLRVCQEEKRTITMAEWLGIGFRALLFSTGTFVLLLLWQPLPPQFLLRAPEQPKTVIGGVVLWVHRTVHGSARARTWDWSNRTDQMEDIGEYVVAHLIYYYVILGFVYFLMEVELEVLRVIHYLATGWVQPPAFNRPYFATSPRDMWQSRWHDMLKDVLLRCGFLPVRRVFSKCRWEPAERQPSLKRTGTDHHREINGRQRNPTIYLITQFLLPIISSFFVSGLVHEYVVLLMTRADPRVVGHNFVFFILQGIAVCLQARVEASIPNLKSIKSKVPRWIKMGTMHLWITLTMPLFLKPFRIAGVRFIEFDYEAWI
ncbi:hypothetical protein HK102_000144 [Quaeritorhiza haematococci]|nr:hypothetical protein HK102_000144 [Quaeritorhiza haematococci]